MKFFKRFLIYLFILFTFFSIIFISYWYAYKRAKKVIVNFFYKRWGENVVIRNYNFNPFSGLSFELIEVRDIFRIKNLRIHYDFVTLIKQRSIASLDIDTLILTDRFIEDLKHRGSGKGGNVLSFSFSIGKFETKFLEIVAGGKHYKLENFKGFCSFERMGDFTLLFSLKSNYPYSFLIRGLAKGNLKRQDIKIMSFKGEDLNLKGVISLYFPFVEFKFTNSFFRNFDFKMVEGKFEFKKEDMEIIYLEGKEKRGEFSFSGRLKNYRDLKKASLEGVSYIKGEYGLNSHKFEVEIINELKFETGVLKSDIYFERVLIDNKYEANGFAKLQFLTFRKFLEIDTFVLRYEKSVLLAKGRYPGEIKIGIDIPGENTLPYLKGVEGKIIGIYKKEKIKSTLAMQGEFKNFQYADFRIKRLNFTFGKDTTGEDFFTVRTDSVFYKNMYAGYFDIGATRKDTLFFFNLGIFTPFAGFFEDKGIIVKGKDYYSLRDSLDKVKIKFKSGIFEASFEKINILDAETSSNLYIDLKTRGIIAFLNLKNLRLERLSLNKNVWISGRFNIDFSFQGKMDTFTTSLSIESDTFFLNDIFLKNFIIRANGSERGIITEINSEIGERGFFSFYGVFKSFHGFSLPSDYEMEIAFQNLSVQEVQNIFPIKFLNFEEGNIFGNFRIKRDGWNGEVILQNARGEVLYTLTPFYHSFIFLKMNERGFQGRLNGYTGKGEFRGNIRGSLKNGMLEELELKIKFTDTPLSYDFVEARAKGFFTVFKHGNITDLNLEAKVEEAYIVPVFKSKGNGGASPSSLFFDMFLKSDGRVFIFNEWIDAELKGDLRVKKSDPVNYSISGELQVVQGKIFYLGNVFEIKEGNVYFSGERSFIPEINLLGEMDSDIEGTRLKILLKISGKINEPSFKLSSDPPLYDESTLIKFLTFGMIERSPFSEIGARGMYLGEKLLSAQVKKQVRVAEFSLTRTGIPSLLVGTYVTPHLYIKYQHDFLSFYKDAFLIKYFINPKISFYSRRERTGEVVTGLEFEFRF